MVDLTLRLLRDAREAATLQTFWGRVAELLREWTGASHVVLHHEAPSEQVVAVSAGTAGTAPRAFSWTDGAGRRVEAQVHGPCTDVTAEQLGATLEIAAELSAMVGRRTALEHDQRLGTFVVELSRWLLAAPERDLMLRYTMQSVMKLFDAEGAYAALCEPGGEAALVVVALGRSAEYNGMLLPLDRSTTGRVVRSGEALITDNVREEPDVYIPPQVVGLALARSAMIAPLQSATGVLGAIGLVRFHRGGADIQPPPPFAIADLHFFTAVAAHVAGGLELAHAVAATRAAADRADAMVNASPLPLVLVDRRGHVHLVNDAGRRVFGLGSADDVVGRPLQGLGVSCAEDDLSQLLAARGADPWHGRVVVTQPSGDRRICDCTITDLEGLGSRDMMVALYDRTEELRAQRELIAREKLATVGEIASGVAHEVNNPLTAIRMEAELLGTAQKDPETEASARAIVREVDRAASIVRSLLQLARRSDTTPTSVQVNDLLRDVAEIRGRVLRSENVDVQSALDPAAPAVLGLGQELMQVVFNLVLNAEHAVRNLSPAVIRLTTQAREGWLRFAVEDSGPGVPADLRGRIFDPFFSTKNPDEGSGLGLAICQRVVSALGGRIRLEESVLGGARFVVELPAAPVRTGDETDIR